MQRKKRAKSSNVERNLPIVCHTRNVIKTDHEAAINCVAITSKGYWVTGSEDHTVRVWDDKCECIATLEGHVDGVESLDVTCQDWIISASRDTTTRVWDLNSNPPLLMMLQGHTDSIQTVKVIKKRKLNPLSPRAMISPRSMMTPRRYSVLSSPGKILDPTDFETRIVTASHDKTLRIWDIQTGECLHTLEGHKHKVYYCSVLQDGVIVSCDRFDIRFWDYSVETCVKVVRLSERLSHIGCLTATPSGQIAAGTWDGDIVLLSRGFGEVEKTWMAHPDTIDSGVVGLQMCGERLITSSDSELKFWNLSTGKCTHVLKAENVTSFCVANVKREPVICACTSNGELQIFSELKKFEKLRNLEKFPVSKQHEITFSNEEVEYERIMELAGHADQVMCVCTTKEGLILTGSRDRTLRLWKPHGRCLRTFVGHRSTVTCISVNRRNIIASGSADHTVRIWDKQLSTSMRTLEGHTDAITAVLVMETGTIISASQDTTVRVWSGARYDCKQILDHKDVVHCVCFLRDNEIATGCENQEILVWDITQGTTLLILTANNPIICLCALGSDVLISGSFDGLHLWNHVHGRHLKHVEVGEPVMDCFLRPNGGLVLSNDGGEILVMPHISSGEVTKRFKCQNSAVTSQGISLMVDGTILGADGNRLCLFELPEFTWEEVLHHASDWNFLMDSLGKTFNTFDFQSLLLENGMISVLEMLEAHRRNLHMAPKRVRSALRPKGDLWACDASPSGYIKFPRAVIFVDGDCFDERPKIGLAIYDFEWGVHKTEESGGDVLVYMFSPESIRAQVWFDNNKTMHANMYRHIFGAFPTEKSLHRHVYPRAGFAYKFDEEGHLTLVERSCTNNIGLYFTVSGNDDVKKTHDGISKVSLLLGDRGVDRQVRSMTKELSMPSPLFEHLKNFCKAQYEQGIKPGPNKYKVELTQEQLEQSWFSYGKQLRDLSTLFFHKFEDAFGPIHRNLMDILQDENNHLRSEVSGLNSKVKRLERANGVLAQKMETMELNQAKLQSRIDQLISELRTVQNLVRFSKPAE